MHICFGFLDAQRKSQSLSSLPEFQQADLEECIGVSDRSPACIAEDVSTHAAVRFLSSRDLSLRLSESLLYLEHVPQVPTHHRPEEEVRGDRMGEKLAAALQARGKLGCFLGSFTALVSIPKK